MKKFICVFLLMAIVITAAACSASSEVAVKPLYGPDDTWAIYWYLCGSDLESDGSNGTLDLKEMMKVALPKNIQVIIEAGGAKEWKNDFDPSVLSRYIYDSEGLRLLETLPSASMGDGKTLMEFLSFCNENYPADHKAVVFWNHGGGSINGIAFDELFKQDSLDMSEVRAAFEAVNFADKQNPPYELIGFDACLMATIDVAATLNGFTRWMIASEETETGMGWEYSSIMNALADNKGINGAELGRAIADGALIANKEFRIPEYPDIDLQMDATFTLSIIDMSRIDELIDAYYDAGIEALIAMSKGDIRYRDIAYAAGKTVNYSTNNSKAGYTNMIDLGDFIRRVKDLLPVNSERVLNAIDKAVYYSLLGEFQQGSTGVSFYHSYDLEDSELTKYKEIFGENPWVYLYQYAVEGELSYRGLSYLKRQASKYPEAAAITPHKFTLMGIEELEKHPVELNDKNQVVLKLSQEQMDQITDAYLVAAIEDADGHLRVLGECNDIQIDEVNNMLVEEFRGVWTALDGELTHMLIDDETDDYVIYLTPVKMYEDDEHKYTSDNMLAVSYTYATGEYEILGVRVGSNGPGIAAKRMEPLVPGTQVILMQYVEVTDELMAKWTEKAKAQLLEESPEEAANMSPEEIDELVAKYLERTESPIGGLTYIDGPEITITESTRFSEVKLEGEVILEFEMVNVLNQFAYSEGIIK